MKLFMLRVASTRAIVQENGKPLYFTSKVEAKKHRQPGSKPGTFITVVSRGPDHWRN